MSRQNLLLVVLGVVLVLVLYYVFAFRPGQQEIATIEEDRQEVLDQQQTLRTQIAQLESIRVESAELEAAVVAAESVVPREPALPAAVRQLQVAANDAGIVLDAISVGRPTEVTAEDEATLPGGLASISMNLTMQGGYYQIVDFLRRLEDPVITPRAMLWSSMSVTASDYPTLEATATGSMFAILPSGTAPDQEAAPGADGTEAPTDGATDGTDAPTDGEDT